MIKLPNRGIVIAPSNMHLRIYDTYKECLGIEVYALHSFLQRFLPQGKEDLEILYEYKKALKEIPETNAFQKSCTDSDFLQACLSFLKDAKKFNIHTFPENSQKEKDLKEILNILDKIPLAQDSIPSLSLPDCSSVYILRKNWSLSDYFWIEKMLEKGAHWIETISEQEKNYISCSNARKEMEYIAQEILERGYKASDCFIAIQNNAEKQVLAQILEAHKIPYTFLKNESLSKVSSYWTSFLEWLIKKDLDSFKNLIEQVYPNDDYVIDYFSSFPEQFDNPTYPCQNIEYEKNNLISEVEWKTYLLKETQTKKWMTEHAYLFTWNARSLAQVGQEVQNVIGTPSIEDISLFASIEELCQQAYPYIQDEEDLLLLLHSISSSHTSPSSRKGVCIGEKDDINGLYKVVFYTGVTSKQFPGLNQYSGIFNEAYVQNITPWPSLQLRLQNQKDLLFSTLAQPEIFYCLYPQSDYAGKSLQQSVEMKAWMQKNPTFVACEEYSFFTTPEFSLSTRCAKELFTTNNQFTGSISRLEKMVKCPLSHFLNYGLYLNEAREWKDVSIRGTILHSILEKLAKKYPKTYATLTYEELLNTVQEEFIFAQKVFPMRAKWFEMQILEITEKLSLIFEQLAIFEEEWAMKTEEQEYAIHKKLTYKDMDVDFKGFVDRIDTSNTGFTIFDYKSSEKELKPNDFYSGLSLQLPTYAIAYEEDSQKIPYGHFYIALKTSPESYDAYKLGNRKVRTFDAIDPKTILDSFLTKPLSGWSYQDMGIYDENPKRFKIPKEVPDFAKMKEDWETIVYSILDQIFTGDIQPNYIDGACSYCKYRQICRNGKTEVFPWNRTEKGEEEDEL
ncbi:MAG: PD-(D/E)XK nuclease family protein [Bacillota bacterium]|nr:PD-(D/E)XK nuclease family protein [Bacillota bacterium]